MASDTSVIRSEEHVRPICACASVIGNVSDRDRAKEVEHIDDVGVGDEDGKSVQQDKTRARTIDFAGVHVLQNQRYQWCPVLTLCCARKLCPVNSKIGRITPHRWREQVDRADTTGSHRGLRRRLN